MIGVARTKEDVADLINVALEALAKDGFELPPSHMPVLLRSAPQLISFSISFSHIGTKNTFAAGSWQRVH